jgi:FkbM family methyltransferase
MLRRLLERVARESVLRRSLPAEFHGRTIYLSADARLAYLFRSVGGAERRLLEWARELVGPGDSVWDVGANCGVFALAAAVRAGRTGSVVAIEPDPFLAALIRRSADRLGAPDARLEVVEVAVAEKPGRAGLHVARRGRASNWLTGSSPSSQAGGSRTRVEVELATLDGLLEHREPPTLVKIDIEGSEARALGGADRLLGEIRPILLMEVSARCREEVAKRLKSNGYQLFDALTNPGDRLRLDLPAADTLALPGRLLSG